MKLRFKVDQSACFRAGIDCENSIVAVNIDPSDLPPEDRNLIADRLVQGINVCPKTNKSDGTVELVVIRSGSEINLIMAGRPDADGLITAVRNNEEWCNLCAGLEGDAFKTMYDLRNNKVPFLQEGMYKPGVNALADAALYELHRYRKALDLAGGDTAKAAIMPLPAEWDAPPASPPKPLTGKPGFGPKTAPVRN